MHDPKIFEQKVMEVSSVALFSVESNFLDKPGKPTNIVLVNKHTSRERAEHSANASL